MIKISRCGKRLASWTTIDVKISVFKIGSILAPESPFFSQGLHFFDVKGLDSWRARNAEFDKIFFTKF